MDSEERDQVTRVVNARLELMGVSDAEVARQLGWSPARWSAAKRSSQRIGSVKLVGQVVGLTLADLFGDQAEAMSRPLPSDLELHWARLREELAQGDTEVDA